MSDYLIDLDSGCWVWQRAKTKAGYGQIYLRGKMVYRRTTGKRGRLLGDDNVYVAPDGERQCRECNRIRGRARTQRWAAEYKEKRAAQSRRTPTKNLVAPVVPPVPLRKCHCGCGADTKIAKQSASFNGYGQLWHDGRIQRAHRVFYQLYVGPIPDGLQIDHACGHRLCVNPERLEPVTAIENVHRTRRKRHEN